MPLRHTSNPIYAPSHSVASNSRSAPMKALIFGAAGQDGQYMARLLDEKAIDWLGVARHPGFLQGDVADGEFVSRLVAEYRPTHIFHFAAKSTTQHEVLIENHRAISTGTVNILEAARLSTTTARIFLSGSALQLKNTGAPIDEAAAPDPSSAYAASRIHALFSARYFRQQFGLLVYFGYFFNHDSELRGPQHVNRLIIDTATRIAAGSNEKLTIGDPTVRKEFNYAGDMMRAVWTLVNQDRSFEAVIGSGEAHSLHEWIDYCFGRLGLVARDHVVTDPTFRADYPVLVSDPSLIRGLGGAPTIGFQELANIMMEPRA